MFVSTLFQILTYLFSKNNPINVFRAFKWTFPTLSRIISSDGSNPISLNIEQTWTSFFEHWMKSNMFIYWWLNSNKLFLASNDQTSNLEPNRAFIRFIKLLIELTGTSFFRTSNELEGVHLLVIELQHPILASNNGTLNFEHCSTHHL